MSRLTIEDGFEWNIRQIFDDLKGDEEFGPEWLWDNLEEVGRAFLNRVDSYVGIDEAVAACDDDESDNN